MELLKELKPEIVWKNFFEISSVPRCSKNEDNIIAFLKDFAAKRSLELEQDDYGNIVIRKGATPGYEKYPVVVLQSHMDMVCEKNNDTSHDFSKDPIKIIKNGEYITADGTTLGADNGIGMAFGLSVLDSDTLEHGPVEVLMTREEEIGLIGATNLSPDLCKGRLLLNIDSDEDGIFYIGCAGGINTLADFPIDEQNITDEHELFKICITGLLGGHSGVDVSLGRGHALDIALRVLSGLKDEVNVDIKLIRLQGGQLHNAIPREAYIDIAVLPGQKTTVEQYLSDLEKIVQDELSETDPEVHIKYDSSVTNEITALTDDSFNRLLAFLLGFPNGVIEMSAKIKDLVQTSSNLAAINRDGNNITILSSQRSSKNSRRDFLIHKIRSQGAGFGAKVYNKGKYPAWDPNPDSPLVQFSAKVFEKVHGHAPELKAIHAGLECGVIGSKYAGMDMISIGPDIKDAHSPKERVRIDSVSRYWDFVQQLLKDINQL